MGALSHVRICDFTGQLAGAGATRFLAAFGAEVIRIEDPVTQGTWDILRGSPPFKDHRRGIEMGAAFQNHNVNKLGITLNLRTDAGKELLAELVKVSDVVTENFAAGVLERWGFGYRALAELRPGIIYVSNCGFGQEGPYREFKSWGPIAQAVSGLTFTSGLPDQDPAGWGYSYMDHTGGYTMGIAVLAALLWRMRTGEGQWVDLSCAESAALLHGPAMLDATLNARPLRRQGSPHSNRNEWPAMAPHGIYPCAGEDEWVAVSCRGDADWEALAGVVAEPWAAEERWRGREVRLGSQDELDAALGAWTSRRQRNEVAESLRTVGIPAAPVQRPSERIDGDPTTAAWGLWPTVEHRDMGEVRVDGLPVHLSETDWEITAGAPTLGEHNHRVLSGVLGLSDAEIDELAAKGVI